MCTQSNQAPSLAFPILEHHPEHLLRTHTYISTANMGRAVFQAVIHRLRLHRRVHPGQVAEEQVVPARGAMQPRGPPHMGYHEWVKLGVGYLNNSTTQPNKPHNAPPPSTSSAGASAVVPEQTPRGLRRARHRCRGGGGENTRESIQKIMAFLSQARHCTAHRLLATPTSTASPLAPLPLRSRV